MIGESSGKALRLYAEMAEAEHEQHQAIHMEALSELVTMFVPVVIHRRIDPIVRYFAPKWIAGKAAAKQKAIVLSVLEHAAEHRKLSEKLSGINSVVRDSY